MKEIPWAVGWCVIGAAACAALAPLEPNLLEEGLPLHVAQRLAHGELLYRDVVVFTGPLPYMALAFLFRLFGESIFVARAAVALLHGVACAALFALGSAAGGRRLGSAAAAVLASTPALGFPLWSLYFYTTLATQLSVVASWATARGVRSIGWATGAGVLVGAVTLCKQPVGVALALGGAAALAGLAPRGARARHVAAFAAGGAGVALATLAVFGARGALPALWQQTVVLPSSFDATFGSPYPNLWPPGRFVDDVRQNQAYYLPFLYMLVEGIRAAPGAAMTGAAQLLYALPLVAGVATALRRLRGPLPDAIWCHTVLLAAAATNLWPRTDWGHLVFVLPFTVVQLVLLLGDGSGRVRSTRASRAAGWAAGGVAAVCAAAAVLLSFYFPAVAGAPSWGPRIPLRPVSPTNQSPGYPLAIDYVRARIEPGETIFVPRAEPLLYFATDTRNPTPYPGVIPGLREEQEEVILRALEDVRFVLMSDIDQPLYTYYRDELPRVQEFLERRFRVAPAFTGPDTPALIVLERAADRGPTTLDLIELAAGGQRFVRGEGGRVRIASRPPPVLATRHNRRPLVLLLGAQGGGIDLPLRLPEGARFETDFGISVMRGYRHPENVRLELAVQPAGGDFENVASWPLAPEPERDTWTTVTTDLSAWSGQAVTLRLQLVPEIYVEAWRRVAWLGSPRLVTPAHPAPASAERGTPPEETRAARGTP